MTRVVSFSLVVAVLTLITALAHAQTPTCDGLSGAAKTLSAEILRSSHPYACCDGTLSQCLTQTPTCRLARRLANQVCRMAAEGKSRQTIERALSRRATSMVSERPVKIDLSGAEFVGDGQAKVIVVAYVCATCPFCAKLIPKLSEAVAKGPLAGKVGLTFREFPIRSHPGSTEGGLALIAATKLGHGWPLLLHIYANFDVLSPAVLPSWAQAVGIEGAKYQGLVADPATRKLLVASKKEGVRNKVDATPTLFINGRRYSGDLDITTVIDVLEEEVDRVSGHVKDAR